MSHRKRHIPDLTYDAGGSVLRMFHAVMGDEHFRSAIRYYLARNEYGNVDNETLIDALAMVVHSKARASIEFRPLQFLRKRYPSTPDAYNFLSGWIRQPSVPMVEVADDSGHLSIEQRPLNDP